MARFEIAEDDPRAEDVRTLLGRHMSFARATTRPEDVFALEADELVDPAVTFFSLRADDAVLGVGALKRLDGAHAEVKSMHTAAGGARPGRRASAGGPPDRGRARARLPEGEPGDGSGPAFEPARRLYASAGFEPCEAFGDYRPSPNSAYMTLEL